MLVEDLICKGKEFHSSGPAKVKQRSPRVDRVLSLVHWRRNLPSFVLNEYLEGILCFKKSDMQSGACPFNAL